MAHTQFLKLFGKGTWIEKFKSVYKTTDAAGSLYPIPIGSTVGSSYQDISIIWDGDSSYGGEIHIVFPPSTAFGGTKGYILILRILPSNSVFDVYNHPFQTISFKMFKHLTGPGYKISTHSFISIAFLPYKVPNDPIREKLKAPVLSSCFLTFNGEESVNNTYGYISKFTPQTLNSRWITNDGFLNPVEITVSEFIEIIAVHAVAKYGTNSHPFVDQFVFDSPLGVLCLEQEKGSLHGFTGCLKGKSVLGERKYHTTKQYVYIPDTPPPIPILYPIYSSKQNVEEVNLPHDTVTGTCFGNKVNIRTVQSIDSIPLALDPKLNISDPKLLPETGRLLPQA